MKKTILLLAALFLFNLVVHSQSFAWQGRMAGTGDAYGLVEDESDFLIHPAAIASSGKDTNAYGAYRVNYKRISQWDNTTAVPSENRDYPYESNGHELGNVGNIGTSLPIGNGRIGIFFEYLGKISDYSGEENDYGAGTHDHRFDIKTGSHFLNLNTVYGKSAGNFKLGGQFQLSYKNEHNASYFRDLESKNVYDAILGSPAQDLYTYKIPFESDYYELLGKLSVEGAIGTVKNTLTLKGGAPLPFASNNKYDSKDGTFEVTMKGEVAGWNIGCDYWLRLPLSKDFSMPFLVSIVHKRITRDGSGNSNDSSRVSYENNTENTNVTTGGGADFYFNKSTKIAIGLYYDYLRSIEDILIKDDHTTNVISLDYPNYPKNTENRVTIKTMIETKLTPGFSLLSGLNAFYGKITSKYYSTASSTATGRAIESDLSTDGYNWGFNISLGTAVKTGNADVEPFINFGYYKLKIDGNGVYNSYITAQYFSATGESEKTDWTLGGGLSVRY